MLVHKTGCGLVLKLIEDWSLNWLQVRANIGCGSHYIGGEVDQRWRSHQTISVCNRISGFTQGLALQRMWFSHVEKYES